jgi:acyl carrier protein
VPEPEEEAVSQETKDRVDKIIVEHLCVEKEKVVPDAVLVDDLAADSLDIVELVMAFEEEFRIEIADDEAEKVSTVRDVHDLIEAKLA